MATRPTRRYNRGNGVNLGRESEVTVSKSISIELSDERFARLCKAAQKSDQTPDAAAALILEEGLRQREFPGVHFRDTGIGRQAFVPGLRLPIYFLAQLAREVHDDIDTIAEYYSISAADVRVSLDYVRAHTAEIDRAIADNEAAEDELVASLPPDRVLTAQ